MDDCTGLETGAELLDVGVEVWSALSSLFNLLLSLLISFDMLAVRLVSKDEYRVSEGMCNRDVFMYWDSLIK